MARIRPSSMATTPPDLVLTSAFGLSRAREGSATAWIRDVLSSRGEEWQGERGEILLSETGTPMFRPEDPAKKTVPLSDFDGFTQP